MLSNAMKLVCVLVCTLAGSVAAQAVWQWEGSYPAWIYETFTGNNLLTRNNGEHAIGVTEYPAGEDVKAWCTIMSQRGSEGMYAYEYKNWGWNGQSFVWDKAEEPEYEFPFRVEHCNDHYLNSGQVLLNWSYKLWGGIFPVECIPGGAPTTGFAVHGNSGEFRGHNKWEFRGHNK
jgi:hypothetical protein